MTNTAKTKVKARTRGKPQAKAVPAKAPAKGYKDHVEGSRKGKVHEAFDKHGQDTAWTLGLKLGLKQGTLRSWFAQWLRAGTPSPVAKASAVKKNATEVKAEAA
jgi:hypothetical protein